MGGRTDHGRNARSLKAFSFLLLALMVASLVLVHTDSYEPAVSYILLYLVSSVGIITAAVVVPLLPAEQFTAGIVWLGLRPLRGRAGHDGLFLRWRLQRALRDVLPAAFGLGVARVVAGDARGAHGRPVLLRPGDAARTIGGRNGPGDRLARLLQACRRGPDGVVPPLRCAKAVLPADLAEDYADGTAPCCSKGSRRNSRRARACPWA